MNGDSTNNLEQMSIEFTVESETYFGFVGLLIVLIEMVLDLFVD
jgi:hypothetical protein